MLHVLKSEVFIRVGGGWGLGPLFLKFLDPPLQVIKNTDTLKKFISHNEMFN